MPEEIKVPETSTVGSPLVPTPPVATPTPLPTPAPASVATAPAPQKENLREVGALQPNAPTRIDESMDMTRFLTAKGEEVKPKVDKDGKPVVDGITTKVEPIATPPAVTTKTTPAARDYSGIPEEDVSLFKTMSNESFNKLKPVYLEHQKVKADLVLKDRELQELKLKPGQLPSNYYQHPQAFVLSPEYNETASLVQGAQTIYDHWQEQLINIRQGKEWKEISIDPKTGQFVLGAAQPATAQAEMLINRNLLHSQNQYTKLSSKLETIQESFKQRYTADAAVLADAEKTYFKALEDKKHFLWPVINQIYEAIPESYRSNPLAILLAKSVAINIQANKALAELATKAATTTATAQVKQEDRAKAGPTGTEINNGGGGVSTPEVSMDAFAAVKNRL